MAAIHLKVDGIDDIGRKLDDISAKLAAASSMAVNFSGKLAQLKGLNGKMNLTVNVTGNYSKAVNDLKSLKSSVDALKGVTLRVLLDRNDITNAYKGLSQLASVPVGLKVSKSSMAVLKASLSSMKPLGINFKLRGDKKTLQSQLDAIVGNGLGVSLNVKGGSLPQSMTKLASSMASLEAAVRSALRSGGGGGGGRGGIGANLNLRPADLRNPDVKSRLDAQERQKQEGLDRYGDMVRLAERNAPINQALKAMRIQRGIYGMMANGEMLRGGIIDSMRSELAQSLRGGIGARLDAGAILGDALIKRGRAKGFEKVFRKHAFDTTVIQDTQAFKDKIEEYRQELGAAGTGKTNYELYSMLYGDKGRRKRFQREVVGRLNDTDRARVAAEEAQNTGTRRDLARAGIGAALPLNLAATAVTALAKAAKALASESVEAYEGIQTLKTQLGVVFSSPVQAGGVFNEIEAYAKKSPFGVETMTQQAVLLKQSGVYASELMDTMERIGDISSGNNEKMRSISDVYARVISSTTVTARDMRQLSNAGVPSYDALADATGIDRSKIRSKLQSGGISSADFEEMIRRLTDKGGMFYGATDTGARTIAARKQNLADARQMAAAAVGESLAKLGGTNTENSFYGKGITLLENIYGAVEEGFKAVNADRRVDNAARQMSDRDAYLAKASAAEEAGDEVLRRYWQKRADEIGADYRSFEEDRLAAQAELYNAAKAALDEGAYGESVEARRMAYVSNQPKGPLALVKPLATLIRGKSDDDLFFENTMSLYQADELRRRMEGNREGHTFERSGQAAGAGFTALDKALNYKEAGYYDIDKRIGDYSRGAQERINTAADDWKKASPLYRMREADEVARRDDALKGRIGLYADRTYDRDAGRYELGRLKASEMEEAVRIMTSAARQLQLGKTDIVNVDGGLQEGAQETLEELLGNIEEVYSSTLNSGGGAAIGSDAMGYLRQVREMLRDDFSKDTEGKFVRLMEILGSELPDAIQRTIDAADGAARDARTRGDERGAKAAEARAAEARAVMANVQSAQSSRTLDVTNREYLNKRREAPLWAQVLSRTTGLDAARIANTLKGGGAMEAYTGNFARRDMFASVGKALLQQGASLKDLSDVLRQNYRGEDSYGHGLYDWGGATGAVEEMAAGRSAATQEALISAYQSQIAALDELTVGSIATRDEWDNLKALSAQLGTAFTLTAQEMSDGTYRFTEATVRAADGMRRELSGKKFAQEFGLALRNARQEVLDESLDLRTQELAYRGAAGMTMRYTPEERLRYAQTQLKTLKDATDRGGQGLLDATREDGQYDKARLDPLLDYLNRRLGRDYSVTAASTSTVSRTEFRKDDALTRSYGEAAEKRGWSRDKYYDSMPTPTEERREAILRKARRSRGTGIPTELQQAASARGAGVDDPAFLDRFVKEKAYDYDGFIKYQEARYQEALARRPGVRWNAGAGAFGQYVEARGEVYNEARLDGNKNGHDTVEQAITADLDQLVRLFKENGMAGDEMRELLMLFEQVMPQFSGQLDRIRDDIHENTKQRGKTEAANEAADVLQGVRDWNSAAGQNGAEEEARFAGGAFAKMPATTEARRRGIWNTPSQQRILETLGLPGNVSYSMAVGRMGESFVPENVRAGLDEYKAAMSSADGWYLDAKAEAEEAADGRGLRDERDVRRRKFIAGRMDARMEEERPGWEAGAADAMAGLNGSYDAETDSAFYRDIGGYMATHQRRVMDLLRSSGGEDKEAMLSRVGGKDAIRDKLAGLDEGGDGIVTEEEVERVRELVALLEEAGVSAGDLGSAMTESTGAMKDISDSAAKFVEDSKQALKNFANGAINKSMAKLGEDTYKIMHNLRDSDKLGDDMGRVFASLAAEMLANVGASATYAGLNIAGSAAIEHNWAGVAAGIALAAAGGALSFGSGMLSAYANDTGSEGAEREAQMARLEALQNNLAELLQQARDDAEYYEKNMRQRTALTINATISEDSVGGTTSVNDMILTPEGRFSTSPDDYIMAMKDPAALAAGGGVPPNISISVVNMAGGQVEVQKAESRNGDGDMDIELVIRNIVSGGIANGDYDDAFSAMQARAGGVSAYS